MAHYRVIDAYIARLSESLPPPAVDELSDGLLETYSRELAAGHHPDAAASTAIAEFGTADDVVAAFVRESAGRRVATGLLATGPAVGACWALSLLVGRAWSWPVPHVVAIAFGLCLGAVVAALVTAATSSRSYRRTRLTAIAGVGLIILDLAMISVAAFAAPVFVWPMVLAIPASVVRVSMTARFIPSILKTSAA